MDDATQPAPTLRRVDSAERPSEWCLTVAFHPGIERVGAQARLPCDGGAWSIGRHEPKFADATAGAARAVQGLDDRRVSRAAVHVEAAPGGWTLRRPVGSSRLRVDGESVEDAVHLAPERLHRGVALLFADTVLVHLRLQAALPPAIAACAPPPSIWGVSAALRASCAAIANAAANDEDVLILGPTGVGKDLAARAIHAASSRREGPWVAVNMAALAPDLAAASLFGVRRGAYTGADGHRAGYFRQATGGTLFLDEIADTPPALQALLLRALQDRELQVVGGDIERVDLRVIAATERDIDAGDSDFRGALRYRLGAQELRLPALRERAEDIGVIAARALASSGQTVPWSECASCEVIGHWARSFEALLLHDWPGNVRELLHRVRQLAHGDGNGTLPLPAAPVDPEAPGVAEAARPRLADLSDAAFRTAWAACDFEVSRMARYCGVSRQAVYRRLQRLDDCRLAVDVPLEELLCALRECRGDLAAAARHLAVSGAALRGRLRASGVTAEAIGP